jgi:hypothetical protein
VSCFDEVFNAESTQIRNPQINAKKKKRKEKKKKSDVLTVSSSVHFLSMPLGTGHFTSAWRALPGSYPESCSWNRAHSTMHFPVGRPVVISFMRNTYTDELPEMCFVFTAKWML